MSLKDKRIYTYNGNCNLKGPTTYCYSESDVKEAVLELKAKLNDEEENIIYQEDIDEIFGDFEE